MGRGGACVPARVALQGRIHHLSLRMMRVFLVWKRRYADVRAGTQAPPLRFRLGRLRVGGWFRLGMDCAWPTYSVWVGDVVRMSLTRVGERMWGGSSL